jgi:Mrp family chromosome partitioning ATPase
MEPVDFGGALLRRWWLLLVLGLVGLLVGLALPVSHSGHPTPLSWSTTAIVGASPPGGPGAGASGALAGGVTTNQISFYARTDEVVLAAAKQVGRKGSLTELEREITVTAASNKPTTAAGAATGDDAAGTIKLSGTGETPDRSAAFTNAFAHQLGAYMGNLIAQRNQGQVAAAKQKVTDIEGEIAAYGKTKVSPSLENQLNVALAQEEALSAASSSTGYLILQPAQASSATKTGGAGLDGIGSSRLVRGFAGLLIGLVLAAGIVLVLEMLDKRIRGRSRAEETFGYPVVAEIPIPSKENGAGVVSVFSGASTPTAEAYRMLRMSVLFGAVEPPSRYEDVGNGRRNRGTSGQEVASGTQTSDGDGTASEFSRSRSAARQVIMVVSAGTEATRPLVVTNLAATFADGGQRVLVMSTHDLHASNRASPPGQDPMAPIAPEVLDSALRPSALANVSSVPLIPFVANSGQLALRMPAVLEAARHLAEVILVEAPPLLGFHDAEALAPSVDVVLIVGECLATTFDQAKRSGDLLRRIGAPVIGIALTNMRIGSRDIRRSIEKPQVGPKNHLEPEPSMADAGHSSPPHAVI